MISDQLIEKVGLKTIGVISKMPRDEARVYLERTPGLDEDEIKELLSITKASTVLQFQQSDYFYQRRKGMAAYWFLGASWSQIGELFQVSRQTVMDGAHKVMGGERNRLATKCTYERLSEYNAQFWKSIADNQLDVVGGTSREIATFLAIHTETDSDDAD